MNFDNKIFKGILELIENNNNFAITTHTNPDGDAVGSTLAWAGVLNALGKNTKVIMPNDCPLYLKWIEGYDSILLFDKQSKEATEFINNADAVFCLDYNNLSRVEEMGKVIEESNKPLVMIDHHPYPNMNTLQAVSSTEACSTAELVYIVIKECGFVDSISKGVAEGLYTGIITDTGGLQHNSSHPNLFKAVAHLLELGVDKTFVHDQLFNVYSYDRMKLLGVILKDNFVYLPEYKSAYMYITLQNQREHDFQLGDSEGIVNMPLSVKDIKFCALFTEYKNKVVKVSFRSKADFPANEFSGKFFNGGGHRNAAGGRIFCSLKEALSTFEKGLESFKTELQAIE